jgi:hypothetical protein
VEDWTRKLRQTGHHFLAGDLVREFYALLGERVHGMEVAQETAGGNIHEDDAKRLEIYKNKLRTLCTKHGYARAKRSLMHEMGFTERSPRSNGFTTQKNNERCIGSWQLWDSVVHLLASGTKQQLGPFVAHPEQLIHNRRDIALCFHDRMLVKLNFVLPPEDRFLGSFIKFICRQSISGFFDPEKTIEGHIDPSVVLLPAPGCAPVRLELMSFNEPSTWTADCTVVIDRVVFPRKKGTLVGSLWGAWREVW